MPLGNTESASNWLEVPAGIKLMEISSVEDNVQTEYGDSLRLIWTLMDEEKAKLPKPVDPDTRQSDRIRDLCSAKLGNEKQPSKLRERLKATLGDHADKLERWLGPDADGVSGTIEASLWIGVICKVQVVHKKKEGKPTYANIGMLLPADDTGDRNWAWVAERLQMYDPGRWEWFSRPVGQKAKTGGMGNTAPGKTAEPANITRHPAPVEQPELMEEAF